MRAPTRLLRTVPYAALGLLLAAALPAQAVHAAHIEDGPAPCYGTGDSNTWTVTDTDGNIYGKLGVLYDKQSGIKCAMLVADDLNTIVTVDVAMAVCTETAPETGCTVVEATERRTVSNFGDTAPLWAAGHCVAVKGQITLPDGTKAAASSPVGVECQ